MGNTLPTSHLDSHLSIDLRISPGISNCDNPLSESIENQPAIQLLSTRGQKPAERYYSTAILSEKDVYIFGGSDGKKWFNGVHRLQNVVSGSGKEEMFFRDFFQSEWSTVFEDEGDEFKDEGDVPAKRAGQTAILWNQKMYVFGGSVLHDGVFEFDLNKKKWKRCKSIGDAPKGRRFHSCVEMNGSLFVFGGQSSLDVYNDIHEYQLRTHKWMYVETSGMTPSKRFHHTAVGYTNLMIVFGGCDKMFTPNNELFEYNISTKEWKQVKSKNIPSARYGHCATILGENMFILGGTNGIEVLDDLYMYNIVKYEWRRLTCGPKLTFACLVGQDQELLVFGGKGEKGDALNEVYRIRVNRLLQM